jgi:hypothetical protein
MSASNSRCSVGRAAALAGTAGPDPRRWLILAIIGLAQLMVVLDGHHREYLQANFDAAHRASRSSS